jgi:hypothetical protein
MKRLMTSVYLGLLILQGIFILLAIVVALLMDTVDDQSVYGRPLLYGAVGVGLIGVGLTLVTTRLTASATSTFCAREDSAQKVTEN